MQRIWIIDVARTLALIGMAAFHLVYDLQMFGVLPPGTATSGIFYYHARIVAGSFLFLAGMGLWLAHGSGLHWHAFWRRWLRIAAAAAGVTLVTRLAMPQAWVFFGILHCIALASLIALPCLRLPALLTLALGATVLGAAWWAPPLLEWTWPPLRFLGLQTGPTYSVDFVPLVPWFGPFLIGLGLARLIGPGWVRLARLQAPDWLAWPGRHSLAIYLLHQPVLIGLLWLILQLV
ncbi:heparan-alpha-glucosaminide N-acetyltransferase [Gemmobacter denitrificans]|uniref:Heparan-alpha-glucosaminide N-acetyltransferase n=1 Tax=Gemmobacter denitrificans TaxID=3123040 RepID=A0ABU8BS21_9RHOB